MSKITILGKPFKEKRLTTYMKKVFIYPTNHGNLTANEIAEIENISVESARKQIYRELYPIEKKKRGRKPKIKKEFNEIDKTKNNLLGSWEQEQLNKGINL